MQGSAKATMFQISRLRIRLLLNSLLRSTPSSSSPLPPSSPSLLSRSLHRPPTLPFSTLSSYVSPTVSFFPNPQESVESVSDPPEPPIPTSPPTQESVIYILKKLTEKPDKALNFFNRVTALPDFNPSLTTHNLMLRILAHKDWTKDFWLLLNSMEDRGHTIDHSTYCTLLTAFKNQNMKTEASALTEFHTRTTEKSSSDTAVASAAKIILGSEDFIKPLQDSTIPLSEIAVAKILLQIRSSPQKALGFFRWAAGRAGYRHGFTAYNAMLRVLGRSEDSIGEFWSLIREMKAEGHEIDIDTYVKISRNFQKKSKLMKETVELYELMMDGPYKPAVQDCGKLLRQIAYTDAPDLDLVYRVVGKHKAAGYNLSKVVYDGIHRSLTSNARFDEAEEILRRMKQEGYEPDNITYSQLVYGLCKAKRLDEACMVLDEMEDSECVPDLKTWTVLIKGHCSAGEVDKALECMTKMIEKGCAADADLLEVLVKGLCSEKRADGAYTLLVQMVGNARMRPWQETYKYLIRELLSVGKLEEALEVLAMMKAHKFPPFADPFGPHIAKHGTIEDAREFLKALTVSVYPTSTAYLHVFNSFFKEGRYAEAQDLLYKCPYHIRKHAAICKLFGSIKDENAV